MSSKEFYFRTPAVTHTLCKISHCECRKMLFSFANVLRKNLAAQGVDRDAALEAIRLSMEEFSQESHDINHECMHLVEETLENFLNSRDEGGDILGRIIFHFVFETEDVEQRVFDDGAPEDQQARREFTPGVIPRPLMRYFLVSVRGSMEGVDCFQSLPVLFGSDYEYITERTNFALELAQDYRMAEDSQDSPIYFAGFFQDMRVRVFALELLAHIRERMASLPLDRLLQIYDNLQTKRERCSRNTEMDRKFVQEDVEQLARAVVQAVQSLHTTLQCELQQGRS